MAEGALGRVYEDGEIICRQGEIGDRMYVIQSGRVVVSREDGGAATVLGEMGPGGIFGEMAIIDREPRSATVRAKGPAQVLTLDKRGFLKRVHEDPSLAYELLREMSHRLRTVGKELSRRHDDARPVRHLIVVARDRPDTYERLAREFAGNPAVEVVMDRRWKDRRQGPPGPPRVPERRLIDRGNRADRAETTSGGVLIVCCPDGR